MTNSHASPASSADGMQQLDRRLADTGNRGGRQAPDLSDPCAREFVVDAPISGKLISLLPVFASTLAVALTRQTAIAAERTADGPERERDVDVRQRVVHARDCCSVPRDVRFMGCAARSQPAARSRRSSLREFR